MVETNTYYDEIVKVGQFYFNVVALHWRCVNTSTVIDTK